MRQTKSPLLVGGFRKDGNPSSVEGFCEGKAPLSVGVPNKYNQNGDQFIIRGRFI